MAAENIDIIKYKSHSYTAEKVINTANKMADKFENGQQAESYSFASLHLITKSDCYSKKILQ
jgi:hypothetical protein